MFVQLIQGRTSDAEGLRAAIDGWRRDLAPGAIGWLGSTGGVTDDGRFFALARFESAEAAARNSERPAQDRWWRDTERLLDGEADFAESEDVQVERVGDMDAAGFVQVMRGRVTDRARARELVAQLSTGEMARLRPEILGSVLVNHGADGWTQTIYFTSEAAAREGERIEPPEEVRAVLEELMALGDGPPEFLDLRQPILHAPSPETDLPGPRASAERAEEATRTS
ncbi:hypothetical protein JKP75_06670 [Blastococcus sp. TML/M2B]|uniref:hypothetical protein n=1 Tax=unclassified Blastococcus TaxID=2619396 RepID=UPI00190A5927|nr:MULTISPECIES: hypothetical protein [unclassified Blastococcus]MBN1092278.1 hypothetical protein [Blastococcus sp. TML/M2B]MBN1097624.1 hypothetical protein [Blastococcus sp. TML/C7B]